MSNDIAIRVSGLGKEYVLGGAENADQSFREMLLGSLKAPFKRLQKLRGDVVEEQRFWALKDVNFEVKRGEVVGIIGRNGAGKSTLLKILSRITDPTEGRIEIKGRISSLLEVGTGFHPELTGRENIFLNGAILGMSRKEITQKFNDIVAFAEVEKFLDTPVKRYSSGMYVRLAFAVAAYLEPEILIVDEVLAVGDAAFQKKCLGKMSDVAKEGRTVLFVSHNMGAVSELCNKAIMLVDGHIDLVGEVSEVIQAYLFSNHKYKGEYIPLADNSLDQSICLSRISLLQNGVVSNVMCIEEDFIIEVETIAYCNVREVMIGLILKDYRGVEVLHSSSSFGACEHSRKEGSQIVQCFIPGGLLNSGKYSITVGADTPNVQSFFLVSDILTFSIEETSYKMNRYPSGAWKGVLSPLAVGWKLKETMSVEGNKHVL